MLACENLSPVSVVKLLNESFTVQVDINFAGSVPGVSAASGKLWDVDSYSTGQTGDFPIEHLSPSSNGRQLLKIRLAYEGRPLACFRIFRQNFIKDSESKISGCYIFR